MKLESPGFEPLSLEWIFGDRISVMQTYVQEGDLMYDPMIDYTVSDGNKSMNAVAYQNSGMGLYQYHDDDGIGRSVDGNGNERAVRDLSAKLNEFTKQWLDTLEQQEHIPIRATLWNEGGIDDADVNVMFDKDGNAVIGQAEDDYEPAAPDNAPDELDTPSDDVGAYPPEKPKTSEPIPKIGIGFGGTPIQVYDSETGYPAPTPPPKVKAEKPAQAEKQTTLDLSLPDPTVTAAMIHEYGYGADYDGILPMTPARAVELHDTGLCIYLLYPDNTEAMAFDRDETRLFDGYCGIEIADWHNSAIYKAQMAIAADAPVVNDTRASESNAREADLLYGDNTYQRENKFGIYQIRDDIDDARDFRFASMKELESHGLTPNRDHYELVYVAPLTDRVEFLSDKNKVLNSIFEKFNVDRPAEFTGRSMSVSDVVVLRCNGDITAHFVDSAGFVELSSFTGDEHNIGGFSQVGKSPTVAELEADVKAGKSISLMDLANAVKNGPQKLADKGKPSILEDLDEATKMAAGGGNRDNRKKSERGYE
jgi:hypothetical protein